MHNTYVRRGMNAPRILCSVFVKNMVCIRVCTAERLSMRKQADRGKRPFPCVFLRSSSAASAAPKQYAHTTGITNTCEWRMCVDKGVSA